MDRRVVAVALCGAAAALALTFYVLTMFCGSMQVEANEPGESRNEATCVSDPHPMAALFGAVSVGAAFLAWRRIAWAVILTGVLVTAAGLLFIFSMGFFGFPVGVLLLVAGGVIVGQPGPGTEAAVPN